MLPDRALSVLMDKFVPGSFDYSDMRRKTVHRYPPEAVREMLTNAIIHKDSSSQEPITVKVRPGSLSVFNFGSLPEGWTVEDLYREHASVRHNYLMAEAFHEAGYIEKWGKGIGMIIESCKEAGLPVPIFQVRQNGLDVTIENPSAETVPAGLSDAEEAVMRAIMNGCRTRTAISAETGFSDAKVKRAISSLTESNRIRREGSNKNGRWVVLSGQFFIGS
ncbi:MAG: hypothetical protein IKH39_03640 [Candidatus Methanomethylophilaceae archaeon]|nr:hypothetical protein [Candidatus Methanomethylophilaceae archaeon]MBR6203573.1 hypothetical protein [Candidatus Methanomethylophilaceae archaeon]